ncbi:MAG: hypothetical protein AAF213_08680 [Pseudomonadota bacterium]
MVYSTGRVVMALGFILAAFAMGADQPQAQQARPALTHQALTHQQALASIQPGLDLDAARTALDWWAALLAQDIPRLRNLSAEPMMIEGNAMPLTALLAQFQSPGIVTNEQDWPMALYAITVIAAIDPTTRALDPAVAPQPGLNPRPEDRLITLVMAERLDNGRVKRPITIHHYAQHLQASQFRITAMNQATPRQ